MKGSFFCMIFQGVNILQEKSESYLFSAFCFFTNSEGETP